MTTINAGTLLIADPFMKDPSFSRSVVLICNHQAEGSIGFIINKLYQKGLKDLMYDIDDLDIPVYFGGPVNADTIHFIHTCPEYIPNSYTIQDGLYWGGNFETAITLLRDRVIAEHQIRFFIGYAGWSDGQLDNELTEKSWLIHQATTPLVFKTPVEDIWKRALQEKGGEFALLSNYPIDPRLN